MRKIINIIFCLLFLFISLIPPVFAEEIKYGFIRTSDGKGVKVRQGPGTSYGTLSDGLGEGEFIRIISEFKTDDGTETSCKLWYKIEFNEVESGTGYVCSDYVELTEIDTSKDFEESLKSFPESYHDALRVLHTIYPNATFEAYDTRLAFNTVVSNEAILGKSLIWDSNNSRDGLKHMDSYDYTTNKFSNNFSGGGSTWYAASKETIAYYIDPRNFLNEKNIFMFESLTFSASAHSVSGVASILDGSFMAIEKVDGGSKTFAEVIYSSGNQYQINPYYLASRILQETGYTRSALVKGTYPSYPQFNGYYNFYNYGAGGNNVVYNGLASAYKYGWNSEEKAITGGAYLIGKDYINVGQNTNYFQKWDVTCRKSNVNDCSFYIHQYMQNIEAPYSESSSTYDGYKDKFGNEMYQLPYVFRIPVYKNMPAANPLPSSRNPINYLKKLTIDGKSVTNFNSLNTSYSITLPSNVSSVNIDATVIEKRSSVSGTGNIKITNDGQVIPITVTAENGDKLVYNITVKLTDAESMNLEQTINSIKSGTFKDGYVTGLTNVSTILKAVTDANVLADVKVTDLNGKEASGSVGTGYKVNITVGEESTTFEVVIYGDTNGDSEITILDLLRVQKHILKSSTLSGANAKAADVSKDNNIDILDLLKVQKHILGSSTIEQ